MNTRDENGAPHVVSPRVYGLVFGVLLALTAATIAAAYRDLGPLNLPVALGIASIKALLVVLVFMHVRYGPRLHALLLGTSIVWALLLVFAVLSDSWSRGWLSPP